MRRSLRRLRRRLRRRALPILLTTLAVVGLISAWLLWTADHARRDLVAVRSGLPSVTAALRAGDASRAAAALTRIQRQARAAEASTSDPVWWFAVRVPYLGRTPAQVQGVAAAARQLTEQTLPAAVRLADELRPARVRPSEGQLDLDLIRQARPDAQRAALTSAAVLRRLRNTPSHGLLASVDDARTVLLAEVRRAHTALGAAEVATRVLPPLLGQDGPRRYFVAFQNNAEARATGGLVGSYAILRADRGRVRLEHVGSARELPLTSAPVIDLGPEYDARYASFASTRDIRNSNVSPHFPDAARVWQALWRDRTGEQLDGAFAVDPVAASYVLGATGPARLPDGQVVSARELVELVESRSYQQISGSKARDNYQTAIAKAVFQSVIKARSSQVVALVTALADAAGERRLLAYSDDDKLEGVLAGTAVGGVLPERTGPFAGLVVTNASGSKLDYYLRRSIRYEASDCQGKRRISQVVAKLSNHAPPTGLPPYVTVRADVTGKPPPAGTERLLVSLFATHGARLLSVTQDGLRLGAIRQVERGHPVFTVDLELPPGQSLTLAYILEEPTVGGTAEVPVQPLVDHPPVVVRVPVCG